MIAGDQPIFRRGERGPLADDRGLEYCPRR